MKYYRNTDPTESIIIIAYSDSAGYEAMELLPPKDPNGLPFLICMYFDKEFPFEAFKEISLSEYIEQKQLMYKPFEEIKKNMSKDAFGQSYPQQ